MAAGGQPGAEQSAGFVAADGALALADHVAVTGVDLDGRAAGSDAEFDDPFRWPGSGAAAVLFFGLALLERQDFRVDALKPQDVPDPQGLQAFQVRRQVIEHIFDSMHSDQHAALSRVRFFVRYRESGGGR